MNTIPNLATHPHTHTPLHTHTQEPERGLDLGPDSDLDPDDEHGELGASADSVGTAAVANASRKRGAHAAKLLAAGRVAMEAIRVLRLLLLDGGPATRELALRASIMTSQVGTQLEGGSGQGELQNKSAETRPQTIPSHPIKS